MQLIPISQIKPNSTNPRTIRNDKFKKLVQSLKDFPEMAKVRPIVVNKEMIVLGGNMRLRCMKEAGWKECPVEIVDWTEEKQKEFLIKDNVGYGEWDFDILANEWDTDKLIEWGLDIDIPPTTDEQKELIEDDVPEDESDIVVKHGDVYKLGDHTLMCGDSMNEEDIRMLISNKNQEKTHCISDPPYGIAYNPDKHGMIKNDDKILDYTALGAKYSNGYFAMWTGYQVLDTWMQIVKGTFKAINNLIIWHKGGGGMGDCEKTLAQDYEVLIVVHRGNVIQGHRGGSTWYWNSDEKEKFIKNASKEAMKEVLDTLRTGQSIWKVKKDDTQAYMHPTQKPVEINQRVLENFTAEGENVLDLFGGSGSNLIACEKTRRVCYMMELDPKYVQTILKRYIHYTGGAKVECINRDIDVSIFYQQ